METLWSATSIEDAAPETEEKNDSATSLSRQPFGFSWQALLLRQVLGVNPYQHVIKRDEVKT